MTARGPRGVTMIEIMVVVAIVGIMSAISGAFTIQMLKSSRVNATARTVNAIIGSARQRAVMTGCGHFVQLNGPGYTGAGATGFPSRAATISIVRKGDCNSQSFIFEAGDRVVDFEPLGPDELPYQVRLKPAAGLITDTYMDNDALVVGYDRLGRRGIFVDDDGSGATSFAENTTFTGADVAVTFEEDPGGGSSQFQVIMTVRNANGPRLN